MTIGKFLQEINALSTAYSVKGRDPNLSPEVRAINRRMGEWLLKLHQSLFTFSVSRHDQEIAALTQCIKDAGAEANVLNEQIEGLTKEIADLQGLVTEGNEMLNTVLDKVEAVKGFLADEG